jgi:adenylate cyclase
MSLIAELRRRNVIRMAGLYLVGAWLITQVAATVLPLFDAPDWMARSVVVLLAIGFVPALVIAWVFELTPEGLKRDADVDPAASIAPQTARRMDRMLLMLAVLALGYFAFDKFVLAPQREAALVASTTQALADSAALQAKPEDEQSIAVLPFVDMSPTGSRNISPTACPRNCSTSWRRFRSCA